MIIISDCLTDSADEGTIKIASKIAKLLKNKQKAAVFQLNTDSSFSDKSFAVGKSGVSKKLLRDIYRESGNILYIPNASMTLGICFKVCILSLLTRRKVFLLPVYRRPINWKMKLLLQLSRAEMIVLSEESYKSYQKFLNNRVFYVKAGVDTKQFDVVNKERKLKLKEKYGFVASDIVILHVGHMVEARNIRKLMEINKTYKIVLIISTSTRWDENLYKDLNACSNIRIIHKFVPNIEEYFQMADVYYFPVESIGCIDVPLSVLEAASCGIPIVTTPYGELRAFSESDSFKFIQDFGNSNILIESVKYSDASSNREKIMDYDWEKAVKNICSILEVGQ